MAAFSPIPGGTYRVTVGTGVTTLTVPAKPNTVRIFNATAANLVYVEPSGLTAAVPAANGGPASFPIAGGAGSIPVLLEKGDSKVISLIASAAGTDVYVTIGHGDSVG